MEKLSTVDLEQKAETLMERAEQHDEARQQAESDAAQTLLKKTADAQAESSNTTDEKRKAHEESEEKRRAEWEAEKKAREEAVMLEWEKAVALDDNTLIASSVKRLGDAVERLTRRNMKLCVTEFVQTKCYEDTVFARQVMHPRKNMLNCFRFINRKAKDYIMQEMKESNEKSTSGVYGGDVPDELCYQWAEEYFNDLNVPEDKDENDKEFMPRLYTDKNSSKSKEKPAKKTAETKPPEKANEQMTLFGTEGVQ